MTDASRQVSSRRRGPAIASLLMYIGLAVLLFSRAWSAPSTSWVGDPGDPAKFMWFLRWNPYASAHGLNPFFTHHIDSLHGVNLLWDTSVALPSVILAPITLLLGPIVAFNVTADGRHRALGVVRIPLLPALRHQPSRGRNRWSPLRLLAVRDRARARRSPRSRASSSPRRCSSCCSTRSSFASSQRVIVVGLLLGVLAGAQLLISQEILVTEALMALAGVIALVILRPREVRSHLPYAARALGIAFGMFVVLAAIPVMAALFSSRRPHHGTLWGTDIFVSDLLRLRRPDQFAAAPVRRFGARHDHFTDVVASPTRTHTSAFR